MDAVGCQLIGWAVRDGDAHGAVRLLTALLALPTEDLVTCGDSRAMIDAGVNSGRLRSTPRTQSP